MRRTRLRQRRAWHAFRKTELVRTYVWEKPVRVAHWLIFFAFLSLSLHRLLYAPPISGLFW